MVTEEERKTFGWLGRIPPEIINAPREVSNAYKALAKEAKAVARMYPNQKKVDMAKQVETKYYDLLRRAKERTNP